MKEQHNTPMAPLCAVLLLFAVVTPLVSADGELDGTIVVDAGETMYATGPLVAKSIVVHGTIVQAIPGDLVMEANNIELAPGSQLRGFDGNPGTTIISGQAIGTDGTNGFDVVIQAQSLLMHTGAVIQSGSGGGAGGAVSPHLAEGGDGGNGGDIQLLVEDAELDGAFLPGAGGDGGDAFTASSGTDTLGLNATGHAFGGDGGDSGAVYRNGALMPVPVPEASAPSTTQSPTSPAASMSKEICFDVDDDKLGSTLWTNALVDVKFTVDSEFLEFFDFGRPCVGGAGGGDDDGDDDDEEKEPPIAPEDLFIVPGVGGDVGPCTANGADGFDNQLGDGGDGGHGCAESQGDDGTDGSNGNSGYFGCSSGGSGGNGSPATAEATSGGNGGQGMKNGGDGGTAASLAYGGKGGDGGDGGKATVNSDCAGGHGGSGGSGTAGSATGGNGGEGTCGEGGSGGSATSHAHGGAGGAGGSGNPAGVAGAPGAASAAGATIGKGGEGLELCP